MELFKAALFFALAVTVFADTKPFNIDWARAGLIQDIPGFLDGYDNKGVAIQEDATRTGRILGGNDAAPNGFPFMAALMVNPPEILCGGSIITMQAILTAADCLLETPITVRVGSNSLTANEPDVQTGEGISFVKHETYDIAILKLESPFNPTDAVQTIALANSGAGTYIGYTASFTGWGSTNHGNTEFPSILQQISPPVISNFACSLFFNVNAGNVCTSGLFSGPCFGDAGGPLTVGPANARVQIGIYSQISNTFGCGSAAPALYTRVSSLRSWIDANL